MLCLIPSLMHTCSKMLDVNCLPLSLWIRFGNPNLENTCSIKALTTSVAVDASSGIKFTNLVNASTTVSTNLLPLFDLGSGPKMSMPTHSNGLIITFGCTMLSLFRIVAFAFAHSLQFLTNLATSFLIFGHQNLSEIVKCVLLIPSCVLLWHSRITAFVLCVGIQAGGVSGLLL